MNGFFGKEAGEWLRLNVSMPTTPIPTPPPPAAGWKYVGQLKNGFHESIDFQNENNYVSLKTVDTTSITWMYKIKDDIRHLSVRGRSLHGKSANLILDLRVQPGGLTSANQITDFAKEFGNTVILKEFP